MQLDVEKWKKYKIQDVFETIQRGSQKQVPTGGSIKQNMLHDGDIPRISVKGINNGIVGKFAELDDRNYRVYENFISVSFLGTVFYQHGKASLDMKVHCLRPRNYKLTKYSGLFLVSVIKSSLVNSDYSNQVSSTILPEIEILLPSKPSGDPDYTFMEEYMKEMEVEAKKSLSKLLSIKNEGELIDTKEWKSFEIRKLFEYSIAKSQDIIRLSDGSVNFIGRSAANNGIQKLVESDPSMINKGECITISMVGTNVALWQEKDFAASQNILIIRSDQLTKYTALFISAILNRKISNFSYSNTLKKKDMDEMKILLPATPSGDPDWNYMEEYMRTEEDLAKQRLKKLKEVTSLEDK